MAPYNLEIPKGPLTTLVADPPWPFKDRLPGPGRGAAKHYDCMDLEDIKAMRRPLLGGLFCQSCGLELRPGEHGCVGSGEVHISSPLTQSAHLYLWAPNAFVHDAWEVAEAWGFQPKTILTWVKTKNLDAPYQMPDDIRIGMGRSFRNCTEHVIVAMRGKLDFLRKDVPSVFFAPRQAHSQKPDIFYDIVESMSPGPRLELFAGRERPGWTYPTKGDSDSG